MTEQNASGPFPDVDGGPVNVHVINQWFSFWRHELTKRGGSMSAWRAEIIDKIEGLTLCGLSAAAIEARAWIPVGERLPEAGSRVWTHGPSGQQDMKWTGEYWYTSEQPFEKPTHWMPLPSPP